MQIKTTRQHLEYIVNTLGNFIQSLQYTHLKNVAHCKNDSAEYLQARVLNSVLQDLEDLLKKKIANTEAKKYKLNFSDAVGIMLYRTLLLLPIRVEEFYAANIRNEWIAQLDQQINLHFINVNE